MYQNSPLNNKVALISGAGKGIGRATAFSLAEMGASLICISRDSNDLEFLKNNLPNPDHHFIEADLSEKGSGILLLKHLEQNNFPHVVIANLSIRRKNSKIGSSQFSFSGSELVENLNYLLEIMPETLNYQVKENFGRWVGISSIISTMSGPGQALYASQKSIMESLFRSIALEYGTNNITANTIAPGIIDTPGIQRHYPEDVIENLKNMNLMKRSGTPEEVAHAVAFLASPLASYITGISLPVCGGYNLSWTLNSFFDKNNFESDGI